MEKLIKIQNELKVPKNQYNAFGKYNYRSCEDILEALKPLLLKYNCCVTICDALVNIGERIYIKAMATIRDLEKEISITVSAFARESLAKKGMDEAQITGASSSYARKYALDALFLLDDTKDADTKDNRENTNKNIKKLDIPNHNTITRNDKITYISETILEMNKGDMEKSAHMLLQFTQFKTKEGKTIMGFNSFKEFASKSSDERVNAIYGIVKNKYEKFKNNVNDFNNYARKKNDENNK